MDSGQQLDALYERLLVVRVQARDREAFRELVMRYERRLLYYLRRVVGESSEALDVMQEVWLLVFRRIGSLRAPEAFRVWLYRIAHDAAVTHLRGRSDELMNEEIMEAAAQEQDPAAEMQLLENIAQVHGALAGLSPAHREVLTLRFLEAMDLNEMAAVIACSTGTVKSRLHYAKLELRRILERDRHG